MQQRPVLFLKYQKRQTPSRIYVVHNLLLTELMNPTLLVVRFFVLPLALLLVATFIV